MSEENRMGLTPQVSFPPGHPIWEEQRESVFLELRTGDGTVVPVILEERDGSRVFVRQPGPDEKGGRVEIKPGDEIYQVTPVAAIFLSTNSVVGDRTGDLFWSQIRQTGRDGNRVFVEVVKPGEAAPERPVYLGPGDQVVFPPGAIKVSFAAIDKPAGDPEEYRPIAAPLWAWLCFSQGQSLQSKAVYLLTVAQKLDLAHNLLGPVSAGLSRAPENLPAQQLQATAFDCIARSHTITILLHRAFRMLCDAPRRLRVKAPSPKPLRATTDSLRRLRDVVEHAEEHSLAGAVETPYDWDLILKEGVLRLDDVSFDIVAESNAALLQARAYLASVADAPAIN